MSNQFNEKTPYEIKIILPTKTKHFKNKPKLCFVDNQKPKHIKKISNQNCKHNFECELQVTIATTVFKSDNIILKNKIFSVTPPNIGFML